MTKVSELEVDGSLSWLQVEGDLLYGSHEDSSLVSRWRLNRGLTQLERLERVEMPGSGPAHILVDRRLVTSPFQLTSISAIPFLISLQWTVSI